MRTYPVRPTVAVLLPGSGSDHVFVTAAFGPPLAALGIRLHAPPPKPGAGVVEAMVRALDAAGGATTLVGGISLGAHVAAAWAARNPGLACGLLVALPGWLGAPGTAPAALTARATADAVRRNGLDATLAAVRTGTPAWLADELDRAWRGYGPGLPAALTAAAGTGAPTAAELATIAVPTGIGAVDDDPVHPSAVASAWAAAVPTSALVTTSLATVGRDLATLGRVTVLGWLRARGASRSPAAGTEPAPDPHAAGPRQPIV